MAKRPDFCVENDGTLEDGDLWRDVLGDDFPAGYTPKRERGLHLAQRHPAPKRTKRKPKKWELSTISLLDIPTRLDIGVDQLKTAILETINQPWVKGQPEPVSTRLEPILRELAEYGAYEVRLELSRQGADIDRMEPVGHIENFDVTAVGVIGALRNEIFNLRQERLHALTRRRMSDEKKLEAVDAHMRRRLPSIAAKYARRGAHECFAVGRAAEIAALREGSPVTSLARRRNRVRIDYVIHTAILDKNTCEECAKVDGEVMDYGSERQKELEPPYYKCEGGENCRCVHFAVLSDGSSVEIVDGKVVEQYEPEDDD